MAPLIAILANLGETHMCLKSLKLLLLEIFFKKKEKN